MATVKLLTLKNGIILIAARLDNGTWKQPIQVAMMPPRSAQDQPSLAFLPFLEYSEEHTTGITIDPADVLTETTPVLELRNKYSSIYGSGIVLASSPLS